MDVTRGLVMSALVVTACSGTTQKPPEDARRVTAPGDGAGAADAAAARPDAAPAHVTGDLQIRVEWVDVPGAARSSPGTTACGTARAPAVAPTTTWGIPDVVVFVDNAPIALGPAHVRLADCALVPRVAVGSTLVVDSAADRPARLTISDRGLASDPDAKHERSAPRTIALPIAGHAVTMPLDRGVVYELATEGKHAETSWVIAAPAAITDASGGVMIDDVPPGSYTVRAWLPPRSGQRALSAMGTLTVGAGELAALTLQLAP